MILDGKTVRFILDPGDQFEAFRMGIYREFNVMVIQASGPVVVILDHAADRNVNSQFFQYRQRNIHLSAAAVHEDQIRELGKAPVLLIHLLFFQFSTLFHAVAEPSRQYFPHAGIVIWTGDTFDLEFTVIAALGFALFIDYHGAYIFKTVDIGNIIGFHPGSAS